MASPAISPSLSRTPSSLFSPSSTHRRSHPNLHHLSLAPLTPKYPISVADYDAYFDPSTADLHTSASLSRIAALPSPGGILSNSPVRSRATSKTRRKNKSSVHIQAPTDLPSGVLTNEGFGAQIKQSQSRLRLHTNINDGWLTQTGLALTEGSRESKGQLWLSKRDSSTSLHSPEARTPAMSGRNTPNRSRRGSKARLSRRNLVMTPAMTPGEEKAGADWVDSQTQAELAAELDEEMAEELEAELDDEYFRDRYGMLDFTGQFDSDDDEKEVRDAIRAKGFRIGRIFDGMVNVLMQLEDEEPDLEIGPMEENGVPKAIVEPETKSISDDSIEVPPDRPRSVWDDLRWFGRVVARTVGS